MSEAYSCIQGRRGAPQGGSRSFFLSARSTGVRKLLGFIVLCGRVRGSWIARFVSGSPQSHTICGALPEIPWHDWLGITGHTTMVSYEVDQSLITCHV